MAELNALHFNFDDGNVSIKYTDINSHLGVSVHVPSLDRHFTELTAFINDDPEKVRFGKPPQTMSEKKFDNPVDAMEFLKGFHDAGVITLKFSDEDGKEFILPHCNYTDITDKEILGKAPVPEQDLQGNNGKGIWANNGLRIINVKIENIPNVIELQDYNCSLVLNMMDNRLLPAPLPFGNEMRGSPYPVRDFAVNEKTINGDIYLDTNRLGETLNDGKQSSHFIGYFHIECSQGISYSFMIRLLVQNTSSVATGKNILSGDNHPAYIDFGTSSTCVCVWDFNTEGPKLLSFNNNAQNDTRAFENPTSVIIYRWTDILKKFNFAFTDNCPPVLTAGGYGEGTFDDYIRTNKRFEFDSGHIVRSLLNKEPTYKQLNSIISRIKTIPYMLNQKKDERYFFSYDAQSIQVQIISSAENSQDDEHINPVLIYGYLLGKMINNASDGRIYTKFKISRPIKFPKEVVEEIRQSLGEGLRLSVPHTLWNDVSIEMSEGNLEPVAYIGALIGKYIKVDVGEKKLFAVFDFGGGTLDTIFGVLRRNEDETAIDIYAQGGEETFGGESLIEKISFELYSSNYQEGNIQLTGDDGKGVIPMRLPFGEEEPANIPRELFDPTRESTLNLQILGEKYSRHFFENPDFNEGESTLHVELLDKEGKNRPTVPLSLNSQKLKDYLYDEIKPRIETFAKEMDIAFNECLDTPYDRSSVKIFKAGNASRNKTLEGLMDTVFSENKVNGNILMPDESSEEKFNPMFGITPKSAVALGQFHIENKAIVVNMPEYAVKWYVGYMDPGTNEFIIVLNKAMKAHVWKKVAKIPERSEKYTLSYKETLHFKPKPYPIGVPEADRGKYLFISIAGETTIEYCFASDENNTPESGSGNIIEELK